jgi:hypothetical protein
MLGQITIAVKGELSGCFANLKVDACGTCKGDTQARNTDDEESRENGQHH